VAARKEQAKRDAEALKDSALWADQQFSKSVAKAKELKAAGVEVPREVVMRGIFPFQQVSDLDRANAVLWQNGFAVVLNPNADPSSPWVRQCDLALWFADVLREVIEELNDPDYRMGSDGRTERKAMEVDYDAIQDAMGRRYLPSGKRKFRGEPRVKLTVKHAPQKAVDAPVARPEPKVAPVVQKPAVSLIDANVGVSRRVW
jgi:hypothetical protein